MWPEVVAKGFVVQGRRQAVQRTHAWNDRTRRPIVYHDRSRSVSVALVWLTEARIPATGLVQEFIWTTSSDIDQRQVLLADIVESKVHGLPCVLAHAAYPSSGDRMCLYVRRQPDTGEIVSSHECYLQSGYVAGPEEIFRMFSTRAEVAAHRFALSAMKAVRVARSRS